MSAEAIYFGCGTFVAFAASVVAFGIHEEFQRRIGWLPPKVVYGKDYMGEADKSKIIWQTPLFGYWGEDEKYMMNFFLFLVKWGSAVTGLFLLATTFIKIYGLK